MRGSERVVIARIFDELNDEDQEDDEQMAMLVGLLEDLADRDLPIDQLVEFMLTTSEGSEDIWLLDCEHLETWDTCRRLVTRDPQRIPVDRVIAAFQHACAISAPQEADDTDDNPYLEALIELAGCLGSRFPVALLIPLVQDERIAIRLKVIAALTNLEAGNPIVAMLNDVSAQVRISAMEHLGWLQKLTDEQLHTLAVDGNARVRDAALQWMRRHRPELVVVATAL